MKVDVEGGEFQLFDELDFNKIESISMEVHNYIGDVAFIKKKLIKCDFEIITCDQYMKKTSIDSQINFIFARKSNSLIKFNNLT